jgi:hypothetical protein
MSPRWNPAHLDMSLGSTCYFGDAPSLGLPVDEVRRLGESTSSSFESFHVPVRRASSFTRVMLN